MTKHECDGYLDAIQDAVEGDVFREMLRVMVQEVMEEELARHLGAERHERTSTRRGHRNGYKPRRLRTRLGELALSVPQVRGMEPYSPLLFAKWQRSERALLVACAEMYFQGVSTRKVKWILEAMGGFELSAATVSCVAQELDDKLTEFRRRRLDGVAWPYLVVDATYVKVRHKGRVGHRAVLVVAGINDAGQREILTWQMADLESQDTWTEVFRDLQQRGVHGVRQVTSDGHWGIQTAVAAQWAGASWQRCWTHFMRQALRKVGAKQRAAVARELRAARLYDDPAVCRVEAERLAQRWERDSPRLAQQIRDPFEETWSAHDLPRESRRRLYTNNLLERVMAEVKRRIRVVGIFPNEAACDRLVGAVLWERHETWQCSQQRYLPPEVLVSAPAEEIERTRALA